MPTDPWWAYGALIAAVVAMAAWRSRRMTRTPTPVDRVALGLAAVAYLIAATVIAVLRNSAWEGFTSVWSILALIVVFALTAFWRDRQLLAAPPTEDAP